MEFNDFVSAGIALVAVIVSLFALKHSNSSVKAANEANDLAQKALDIQQEADQRNWIRFFLKNLGRGRFELRNNGTKTALNVIVDVGDLGIEDASVHELGDFPPGKVEAMILHGGFDPENEKVHVHWEGPDGRRDHCEFLVD